MLKFIAGRLVQIVITFFLFLTVVFVLFQAMPGDYMDKFLMNPRIPPQAKETLKIRLGLAGSPWEQYVRYLGNVVRGNLGVSFDYYPREVWDVIKERLPRTVALFLVASVTAFALGFPLGRYIAWRRGQWGDYLITVSGVLFYTVFTPLLALVLLFIFSSTLGWFRTGGFLTPQLWIQAPVDPQAVFVWLTATLVGYGAWIVLSWWGSQRIGHPRPRRVVRGVLLLLGLVLAGVGWWASGIGLYVWDIVQHMVLPVLAVTLIGFGGDMLLTRDSMLEVLREDYVTTAKAKGLPDRVVRDRHAARTALLPVVTSFTLSIGFIVSGGIVTETMFSWKGMGLTFVSAVQSQDFPLAMGCLIFTGILALVAHLVADVLYAVLDPRISY